MRLSPLLPVWLILAPRDYLATFLKIGVIVGLAIGILVINPDLKMPAVTQYIDGTGPLWKGALFPSCLRLPRPDCLRYHA
jgi:carbon starvation protein